jgi:hypothetical protein
MITAATILPLLKRWWPVLAAAALFGVLLTLAYCKGQSAGKSSEIIKQQDREIEVQKDLGKANENAADKRLSDLERARIQERELTNALQATSDPDRQRALRGCLILRQQGRDISNLPACR